MKNPGTISQGIVGAAIGGGITLALAGWRPAVIGFLATVLIILIAAIVASRHA